MLGRTTTQPAIRRLNAGRGWDETEIDRHAQLWLDADWSKIGAGASPLTGLDVDTLATTAGLDVPVGRIAHAGITGGYREMDGRLAYAAPLKATAWTAGGYASIDTRIGV